MRAESLEDVVSSRCVEVDESWGEHPQSPQVLLFVWRSSDEAPSNRRFIFRLERHLGLQLATSDHVTLIRYSFH